MTNQAGILEPSSITVLLPTYRRPAMLRHCLQSIERQSRKDLIAQVLVSENSDDQASEQVAGSFADNLPIHFLRQDPPLFACEHFVLLSRLVNTEFTALIGDDDMWGRYHLEEAARAYRAAPNINAFFGEAIVVCNERCYPLSRYTGSLLQVPPATTGVTDLDDFYLWNARDTAMHCMAHTPLNMWSSVTRTSVLTAACELTFGDPELGANPSGDKMLIWKLATAGPLAISREITLFYREHPLSTMISILDQQLEKFYLQDYQLTRMIEAEARALGFDPVADWRTTFQRAQELGIAKHLHTGTPLLYRQLIRAEDPLAEPQPSSQPARSLRQRLHNLRHLLTPPLLSRIASRRSSETHSKAL